MLKISREESLLLILSIFVRHTRRENYRQNHNHRLWFWILGPWRDFYGLIMILKLNNCKIIFDFICTMAKSKLNNYKIRIILIIYFIYKNNFSPNFIVYNVLNMILTIIFFPCTVPEYVHRHGKKQMCKLYLRKVINQIQRTIAQYSNHLYYLINLWEIC